MKLRKHLLLLAAITFVLCSAPGVLPMSLEAAQTPTYSPDPFKVTLLLEDIYFEPSVLEVPANQDALVRLENSGAILHSFSVPELGIDVEVAPGESADVVINAAPGDYPFTCTVPGHDLARMTGTLRVVTSLVVDFDASPSSVAIGSETSDAATDLHAFLPDADQLDGRWTVPSEGERTREEVIELLGVRGEELIDSLEWRSNAFRNFERMNITDSLYEATGLTVSIHAFADSEGAANALQPLSEWVADIDSMESVQVDSSADSALAFSGLDGRLPIFVLYVQDGNLVIRVGANSLLGDPRDAVIEVSELVLQKTNA